MKSLANGSGPAADARHPLRGGGRDHAAKRRAGAVDVTGRHHDDHRLRLVRRDQVVEDEARAADRGPRIVDVAGAVQQIEHGITLAVRLVSGRRVHVHAPDAAERGRVVVDRGDRAVRHVLRVEHVRAGHDGKAVDRGVGLARHRIARIDDRNAVDDEDVAIGAGGQRADRRVPTRRRRPWSAAAARRRGRRCQGCRRDSAAPRSARLARESRNVTRRSAPISGDVTVGPCGPPRPGAGAWAATGAIKAPTTMTIDARRLSAKRFCFMSLSAQMISLTGCRLRTCTSGATGKR